MIGTKVGGIVLAGGRGSRMGGADKAMLMVQGKPALAHVLDRLQPQCAAVAISANGDSARFERFGLPILPDSLPDFPGPLAGILAGLEWAAALGLGQIVSVAADSPFFPADLVARLAAVSSPMGLTLAASAEPTGKIRLHPTFGLWPVGLCNDLRAFLASGQRKVRLWTEQHQAATCVFAHGGQDPFFNINTDEDLAQAQHLG
jgi:molybdenum cofactor guanylyltransferase